MQLQTCDDAQESCNTATRQTQNITQIYLVLVQTYDYTSELSNRVLIYIQ